MAFKRFVEVGRVVLVQYGPSYGKLAVIADVMDQKKCLIDGPTTGVQRQLICYKRLALLDQVVEIKRGADTATVKAAAKSAKITETFRATGWGKKLSNKKKRAAMSDFDRFKLMVARKEKSRLINKEFKKLKKQATA